MGMANNHNVHAEQKSVLNNSQSQGSENLNINMLNMNMNGYLLRQNQYNNGNGNNNNSSNDHDPKFNIPMNTIQLNQLNAVKSIMNQVGVNHNPNNSHHNHKTNTPDIPTIPTLNSIPHENILQEFLKMQCRNNIASDTLTNALKQPDTLSEDSNDVHIPKVKGAHHARDHSQEDGGGSDNSQGKKRDKKEA